MPPDASGAAYDANAAGQALREAREAAGMSIEAVAQQLKLAPRQVAALENGSYAELPGRTFVRGFARNYARLLHLDADALVAALPDPTVAPALDQPSLGGSSRSPVFEERPRRRVSWAIPLMLVALIGGAAIFELQRSGMLTSTGSQSAPAKPAASEPLMAPALPATTPLPNPLTTPADTPASTSSPAEPPSLPITPAPASPAPATTGASSASNATLVITYRAASWTEVRDASGNRLLVGTMPAGSTQTITGAAPFDVVLGNVSHATMTWRGATVDTSAYLKQNVARLRLD